ncbi:MAG TPA: hypothetical protein VIJ84_06140 [Gaiellaceae bacterium]
MQLHCDSFLDLLVELPALREHVLEPAHDLVVDPLAASGVNRYVLCLQDAPVLELKRARDGDAVLDQQTTGAGEWAAGDGDNRSSGESRGVGRPGLDAASAQDISARPFRSSRIAISLVS